MRKHPMQPVVMVGKVARFKGNQIVRYLLDAGPFDMNDLAIMKFTREDQEQFAQLIGYSVSGAGDLGYMSKALIAKANAESDKLFKKSQ